MPISLGESQQLSLNSEVPQGSVQVSVLLNVLVGKGVEQ